MTFNDNVAYNMNMNSNAKKKKSTFVAINCREFVQYSTFLYECERYMCKFC